MCIVLIGVSAFLSVIWKQEMNCMYFIDGIQTHNINNCNRQLTIIMGALKATVG